MTQTEFQATPKTRKTRTPSVALWHAFTWNSDLSQPQTLSAPSQQELKRQLNELENIQVLSIVRGSLFKVRVQKAFEFVGNDEVVETIA